MSFPSESARIVTSIVTDSAGSSVIVFKTLSASATNIPTITPLPLPRKNSVIGPAVGVPVGVIVLAAIVFFLWRCQKSRRRGVQVNGADDDPHRYEYDGKGELGPPSIAVPGSLVVHNTNLQPRNDVDAIVGGSTTGQSQYRGIPTTVNRIQKQSHLTPSPRGVPVSPSHSELSGGQPVTPPPPQYNELDGREKQQGIQYELLGT